MPLLNTVKQRLTDVKYNQWLITARQTRRFLADLYPSTSLRLNKKKREALVSEFNRYSSVSACMEFSRRYTEHGSIQILWEIESAIKLIADARPRVMCEIGTFDGGTSLLFSKFLTTVEVMICIDLYVKNKQLLKLLAPPTQQLRFFDGSSYSARTIKEVSKFLNGQLIDVLFIDGDHRYEGVKQDFLCYRSFVKDGGLILFHDIVPDKGISSDWTGGVPRFWKQISPYYQYREFIQNTDQGGYGIGVLTYSKAIQPTALTLNP
jgi:cephalosporin hydroxylase